MNAIVFDRVSKHYHRTRRRALREDLAAVVPWVRAAQGGTDDLIEALDDVSFEIPEGQSFALIGENGAGKTTALKLASRISYPTRGRIGVRGRVGALIEVGTGMHPELTGRENVQLYGRILGFSRREIQRRFDEIVSFAGIGLAIEQPVKQFSSGMQLRLGFALAAHLEPDVLLVDEAIAVGDAGFQYRCAERMSELVREGRTLVFVSHDMSAIEALCERTVLLRQGRVVLDGPTGDVIRSYLLGVQERRLEEDVTRPTAGPELEIVRVTLHDQAGAAIDDAVAQRPLRIRLHYLARQPIPEPIFTVGLGEGTLGCFALATMSIDGSTPALIEGEGSIDCVFSDLPLLPRVYEIWGSVRGRTGFGDLVDWQRLRLFRVGGSVDGAGRSAVTHSLAYAPIRIPYAWESPARGSADGQDEPRSAA
jgi:ABC-type polysaccharide/polyol phosphate transport system ATPase subunit